MSNNLKDILSNLNKDIEQEKLLEYLNNELASADQHRVEEMLNDDDFASDAMEGLQQFENKKELPDIVGQLNAGLKKELDKKKKKQKRNRKLPDQQWMYVAAIIILLICILTYLVVKRLG